MSKKSKKNVTSLLVEIVFSVVVAGLLSGLLAFAAIAILAALNVPVQYRSYVNYASGVLFGLFIGYKLRDLVLDYKK